MVKGIYDKKRKLLKVLIVLVIVTIISSMFVTSTFAWYGPYFHPNGDLGDLHFRDTENWAKECGMTKAWALKVGEYCALVDVLYKKDLRWHLDRSTFTGDAEDTRVLQSRNEFILAKRKLDEVKKYKEIADASENKWDKAKYELKVTKAKEEAIMYLGRSIHPLQDIYAHMDAGKNKTDKQIGLSHGMLDAEPVDVTIIYKDGSKEIRKMKLEQKDSNGFLYSLYDDVFYDYDGGWIFRVDGKKEDNKRWKDTKNATSNIINDFLSYASDKGVSYK